MKFTTTTTSSLLLASMALSSPSLSVAAPTGIEAPTSPNPAGTPNIRQFDSPLFDVSVGPGLTPSNKRAPAFRTGPGSPRRNIPSRMVKVSKRQNAPDEGSSSNFIYPLVDSVSNTLSSLPIIGPLLGGLLPDKADARVKAASVTDAPLSDVNHISDSLSGLPTQIDPSHLLNELPSGHALAGLGLGSFSNALTGLEGSLPPVNGAVGGITGAVSGIIPSGHPDPSIASGSRIIQLPNGGLLIDINGVWREVPSNNVFAAESTSVSAVAGSQPSAGATIHPAHPDLAPAPITSPEHNAQTAPAALAFDDGKSSSLPGVSVHPPSPPPSKLPVQPSPSAPATTPAHPSVQPSVASAAVSPPVSKLSAHPAAPTGTAAPPNTPTEPNPKIQAVQFQPESIVSSLTPDIPTADAADGFLGDLGSLEPLEPKLIHGMAAP